MIHASVIVPTFNGAARIAQCLAALKGQKTPREFEVIVVDDGSSDSTAAAVEDMCREFAAPVAGMRLLRQSNAGPGAARNRGVREARGEIVLFVDDDCVPQSDWFERMLDPFADPQIVAAKGAYLTRQREVVARFVQIEYEEKYARLSRRRFIDFIDTYSAAFRRDVFLAAGGYDERFTTASVEDQELSFRLDAAGRRMVFAPLARVWHTHVPTVRGYLRKKFKIGYWKVLALSANPGKLKGDSHTPATLRIQVALAPLLAMSLAGLAFWPWGVLVPLGVAGTFALTALPLTVRCLRRDLVAALAAPWLIAGRAAALACGLAWGLLRRPGARRATRQAAPRS